METTLINSNWDNKTTVLKGNYGENLVDKYLEERGYVCYFPKTKGAHWFDRLAVKDKERVIVAECKTKARMNCFEATGFDYRHYQEYKRIYEAHKIHVFVFFVDEWLGKIYGNFLTKLEEPIEKDGIKYPKLIANNQIIIFPLCNMRDIALLTSGDVEYLTAHSTRKYAYEVV